MKKLPNLDILRLFLALSVVIYHIPLISATLGFPAFNDWAIFHKGELAVNYFFALSGFLIIRLLYIEKETQKKISIKSFYLRRILRIYPVYYFVFIFGVLLYHFLLPMAGIPFKIDYDLKELILSYVFLFPNVHNYTYPGTGSILIVLSSIGIEEQFYLFIPFLLYLIRPAKVIPVLGLLLLVDIVLCLIFPVLLRMHFFYFYFIAGGIISIMDFKKDLPGFFKSKIYKIGILLVFLTQFFTNYFNFETIPFAAHLFTLVLSSLFIQSISDSPLIVIRSVFLNYLGKISYGIYMYHMIVVSLVLFLLQKSRFNSGGVLMIILINVLSISLTLIMAHLSMKYIERKFLHKKERFRKIALNRTPAGKEV